MTVMEVDSIVFELIMCILVGRHCIVYISPFL